MIPKMLYSWGATTRAVRWQSTSLSDRRYSRNTKKSRYMSSSLRHSRACPLLQSLTTTTCACMVAYHQLWPTLTYSIKSIDSLSLPSRDYSATSFGRTPLKTIRQWEWPTSKTRKGSARLSLDWSQWRPSLRRITSCPSSGLTRYKSRDTRCIAGEASPRFPQLLQYSVPPTTAAHIVTKEQWFWSKTTRWTLSSTKMWSTPSTCLETSTSSRGPYLF